MQCTLKAAKVIPGDNYIFRLHTAFLGLYWRHMEPPETEGHVSEGDADLTGAT